MSLRGLSVLALLVALLPGSGELVENLAHLVGHGDLAHIGAGHDEQAPEQEHACSGTFHLCPCHQTPCGLIPHASPMLASAPPSALEAIELHRPPLDHERGVFRPPRVPVG